MGHAMTFLKIRKEVLGFSLAVGSLYLGMTSLQDDINIM